MRSPITTVDAVCLSRSEGSTSHRCPKKRLRMPTPSFLDRENRPSPGFSRISVVVSRGCPQHCDFCYKDAFFEGGRSFYTQRVDDALAEISRLPGRHLYFLDDHLLGDRRFAQALFEGMKGMRRLFQGAAAVDSILR